MRGIEPQGTWCSRGILWSSFALMTLLACTSLAHAQGCSQCRETIGQAPRQTQAAYRHAITAMTVAAGTLFLASIFVLKRFR